MGLYTNYNPDAVPVSITWSSTSWESLVIKTTCMTACQVFHTGSALSLRWIRATDSSIGSNQSLMTLLHYRHPAPMSGAMRPQRVTSPPQCGTRAKLPVTAHQMSQSHDPIRGWGINGHSLRKGIPGAPTITVGTTGTTLSRAGFVCSRNSDSFVNYGIFMLM